VRSRSAILSPTPDPRARPMTLCHLDSNPIRGYHPPAVRPARIEQWVCETAG